MKTLILLPLLLGLGGCAFSEDVATIIYTPTDARPIQGAAPVCLTVTDARTIFRTRIAMKQNGYGMDGAAIRASRPVPDIVRDALAAEFNRRGFTLAPSGRPVSVAVNNFYNSFGTGVPSGSLVLGLNYFGDSHGQVGLTVTTGAFLRRYDGLENDTVMFTSGSNAAHTLAAGMQDAIGKMFADPAFVAALTGQTAGSAAYQKPNT